MKNIKEIVGSIFTIIKMILWFTVIILVYPFYRKDMKEIINTMKNEIKEAHRE